MADYEVGYKKPPEHSRFRKGTSGNPSGKPKATTSVLSALENTLSAPVTIARGGQRLTVTRLEAAMEELVKKAAQGDTPALRLLSVLLQTYQPPTESTSTSKEELDQADQKILSRILSDFARN